MKSQVTFIGLYLCGIEKLRFPKQLDDFFSFPEVVPGDAKFTGSLNVHKGVVNKQSFGRIQFVLIQNPLKNLRVWFFHVKPVGKINLFKQCIKITVTILLSEIFPVFQEMYLI